MKEFLALKGFLWRYRWYYICGILSILFTDLSQITIPRTLGQFTDDVKDGTVASEQLWSYIGALLLAAAGIFVFRYLWRVFIFGAARTLEYELRNKLFAHYQTLPTSWYNNRKTGDLMAHATNDMQAIRFSFGGGVVMAFDIVVLLTLSIFMMVTTISWELTLVGLLPMPLMAFIALRFGTVIHQRSRKAQEAFSNLTDRVQENLSGMRVIKAFAQEDKEVDKFQEANEFNFRRNMNVARIQALFNPLVQWITGLSLLLVLSYGGILVIRGKLTLGEFVAFNAYLGLLTGPILAIGWMINIFQRGAASMARLNEIFNTKGEIFDGSDTLHSVHSLRGNIDITNLTLTYPGSNQPALRGISVSIPEGKTLAIIGHTGSGKTTLANVLVRLYNVEKGKVFINGNELMDIPLMVLRRDIGYVPQENFLFSETIRENIGFGIDKVEEGKVEQAAEDAQLLDNIQDFPEQFETMLGERGVTLSGGQKQRLSIARALIKNPAILIMDDSLSAVDTRTEEAILERLKRSRIGRTTILIAHRISTIKHADQIIVMEEGSIIERGTHHQLIKKNGVYRELYEKQLLEEKVANEM